MRHLVAYFLSALLWLSAAQAQTAPASLIADAISVDASQRLTASGNVEVLYQDYVLKATRIIYDPTTDLLTIEGPLSIVTGDGTFLLASSAEVSPDLANGLLRTARLILDRQLQLAASNLHRIDGRYTVLDQTVATSCTVCGTEVPLWQIRAARVIHDQQERQLYFTDARFEVAGVPLMYLPRLRLPDPTLERATGFLVPDIRVSEQLGVGLQVPYFVTLGPHADLTFGPYISSRTRTLDVRFRRAFAHGEIELNGAVSDDALRSGVRAYLFAEGQFDLPRDFVLDFDLKSVSDSAYLLDYGISSSDRLASPVSISRTRHDERIVARATVFESLREGEDARLQPRTLLEAATIRRFSPGFAGGIATLQADFLAFDRPSEQDVLGRDLERASFSADWQRNWLSQWGLVFETQLAARGDLYSIQNDSTSPETTFRTAQFAAAELRWPLLRRTQSGATQVLEPVLQLVWSGADNDNIPNEDSLITEFDEGNLFSLSRFPGVDAIEQGLRANIGVNWSHHSPGGWQWHTTAGRILRANKTGQFDDATGLNGAASNWVLAVHADSGKGFSATNRTSFDEALNFSASELQLTWLRDDLALTSGFLWQAANRTESQSQFTNELWFDGSYRFSPRWQAALDWRFNVQEGRASRSGVGLEYRNDCVAVNLSLSRRFTSSASVEPTTDFELSVSLAGFGSDRNNVPRRNCIRY